MILLDGEYKGILKRHDLSMRTITRYLPDITRFLKIRETLSINKELYNTGVISKEEYIDILKQLSDKL